MSFFHRQIFFCVNFSVNCPQKREKNLFCILQPIKNWNETKRNKKKNNFVYKVRILERKTELLYEIRVLLFFVALLLKYRKGKKLLICLFWLLAQKHLQKYAGTAKLIFFIQVTDSARQFFFVFLFTLWIK